MTEYLNILLDNIQKDEGKKINYLIESNIIYYQEVFNTLLKEAPSYTLLLFAKYIKKVSKEDKIVIVNELIRRNSIVDVFNFAFEVDDPPVKLLEEAIVKSRLAHFIYVFARDVKGANINILEEAIIDIGNAEYIFRFAKDVKGANISNLTNAIIKSNNAKYICLFAIYVPNANIELLEEALVNIGDINEYQSFLEYKKELQDKYFDNLNNSIANDNKIDIEENREKYTYLFKEPSAKAKLLVKKITKRAY